MRIIIVATFSLGLVLFLGFTDNTRICKYNSGGVIFKITVNDEEYSSGDTLKISYDVRNMSDSTIFIFDPERFYLTEKLKPIANNSFDFQRNIKYSSQDNLYIFRQLGGEYQYNIGYAPETHVALVAIPPKGEYHNVLLLVVRPDRQENAESIFNLFWPTESQRINSIFLYIGFYCGGHLSNILEKGNGDYSDIFTFKSDSLGFFQFEARLNRFQLGPLIFCQK